MIGNTHDFIKRDDAGFPTERLERASGFGALESRRRDSFRVFLLTQARGWIGLRF